MKLRITIAAIAFAALSTSANVKHLPESAICECGTICTNGMNCMADHCRMRDHIGKDNVIGTRARR